MKKFFICLLVFLSCVFSCLAETGKNFKSTLDGKWYPAERAELTKQLAGLYKDADAAEMKDVIALIQPHAGFQYSGKTAFCGLKSLGRSYRRIVILGPSHTVRMTNIFSVPKYDSFETLLGKVSMDVDFIEKLLKHPIFKDSPEALTREHSVQIQVPLLQYAFQIRRSDDRGQTTDAQSSLGTYAATSQRPATHSASSGQANDQRPTTLLRQGFEGQAADFPKIVFIIAGQCSMDSVKEAATILRELMDDDTLLLISSDFTHFGDNYEYLPFRGDVPAKLKELDFGAYEMIRKKDADGFAKYIGKTGDTICGYVPIETLLAMLPENASAVKIAYTTSGEIMKDYSSSVSYFSIAFSGKWGERKAPEEKKMSGLLSEEDKKTLLALARKTIVFYLDKGKIPEPSDLNIQLIAGVKEKRSCFVTLKENGELRGCIGEIFPSQPLYKSVIAHAVASAFRDPRFEAVSKSEVGNLSIEISALTPPKEVASYKEIRIGTDGMVLKKGIRSAVFLPQVATEQGWNLEQTLSALSRKAGLPENAWKEGASYLTFQAEVFGEGGK
ncbi:MAG: AmmeMemoRadiSam system protein B [Lentisphaerota bacterium]